MPRFEGRKRPRYLALHVSAYNNFKLDVVFVNKAKLGKPKLRLKG
jgi:hypothetical protein